LPDFDELKFEPLVAPNGLNWVPRKLFEQIKCREWDVENIYKYGPLFIQNPLNRFWVLTDLNHSIKGVLWITIDPVVELIAVNVLSIDKQYQKVNGSLRNSSSGVIEKVAEFLHRFQDELKEKGGIELKRKILWTTTRPRACIKAGARKYRTIMEI